MPDEGKKPGGGAGAPREGEGRNFIAAMVSDAANPPDVIMLTGYPGASSEADHRRLYADPLLSAYWEVPEKDILAEVATPRERDPLGSVTWWVKADSKIIPKSKGGQSGMSATTMGAAPQGFTISPVTLPTNVTLPTHTITAPTGPTWPTPITPITPPTIPTHIPPCPPPSQILFQCPTIHTLVPTLLPPCTPVTPVTPASPITPITPISPQTTPGTITPQTTPATPVAGGFAAPQGTAQTQAAMPFALGQLPISQLIACHPTFPIFQCPTHLIFCYPSFLIRCPIDTLICPQTPASPITPITPITPQTTPATTPVGGGFAAPQATVQTPVALPPTTGQFPISQLALCHPSIFIWQCHTNQIQCIPSLFIRCPIDTLICPQTPFTPFTPITPITPVTPQTTPATTPVGGGFAAPQATAQTPVALPPTTGQFPISRLIVCHPSQFILQCHTNQVYCLPSLLIRCPIDTLICPQTPVTPFSPVTPITPQTTPATTPVGGGFAAPQAAGAQTFATGQTFQSAIIQCHIPSQVIVQCPSVLVQCPPISHFLQQCTIHTLLPPCGPNTLFPACPPTPITPWTPQTPFTPITPQTTPATTPVGGGGFGGFGLGG
jgi:hypothetical protein